MSVSLLIAACVLKAYVNSKGEKDIMAVETMSLILDN